MKIYVAGPMTGIPEHNLPAFSAATKRLRKEGHVAFSPPEEDIKIFGSIENAMKYNTYRNAMKTDLNWILDNAEGIYLLKGWENSKGTAVELALANLLKLEVMYEL